MNADENNEGGIEGRVGGHNARDRGGETHEKKSYLLPLQTRL